MRIVFSGPFSRKVLWTKPMPLWMLHRFAPGNPPHGGDIRAKEMAVHWLIPIVPYCNLRNVLSSSAECLRRNAVGMVRLAARVPQIP